MQTDAIVNHESDYIDSGASKRVEPKAPTIEQLKAVLAPLKRCGTGWITRCPLHNDRKPSLSISLSGRRLLVKCFAGCDQDTVFAEVMRRLGGSACTFITAAIFPAALLSVHTKRKR